MSSPSQNAITASENNTYPRPGMPNRSAAMDGWVVRQEVIRGNFLLELWGTYATELTAIQHVLVVNRAWEDGHSEGYGRVENVYQELVQFYTEMRNAVLQHAPAVGAQLPNWKADE